MAIAFVGVATTNPAGISTSVAANIPAHSAGDLLIAQITENRANTFSGAPTGWTLLDQVTETSMIHVVCYRVADGTEPSTVTFSFSSTTAQNLAIVTAYSGVDNTTPFIAHGITNNTGAASADAITPSLNNTNASAWAVAGFGARQVAATGSFTTPAGMTERADIECGLTTTAESCTSWDDRANAPTGSQSYDATYIGSTTQWTAFLAFLSPAAGGGSTPVALTGAVCDMALAAPAGTVATQVNVALAGQVGAVALAAPAGTVATRTNIALTGAVSDLSHGAPAGTLSTKTNVALTGAGTGLALVAPAGTVAAGSSVPVSLAGAVANLALAAPAGTVATIQAVALSGPTSSLALAAPSGTVAAGSSTPVSLTGAATSLTLTAPAGTAATTSDVTLSGPVSALTLAALAGQVATRQGVAIVGAPSVVTFAAPAGTVAIVNANDGKAVADPRLALTLQPSSLGLTGADFVLILEQPASTLILTTPGATLGLTEA